MNCRACGKFTPNKVRDGKPRLHCGPKCYGIAQRGKSREDRTSPSVKEYVQVRHPDGRREYLHRLNYRKEHNLEEIPEGMVVHHKTENKRVNDPKQLGLMSRNEHTPNAHYHWRSRDYRDDSFREVDPDAVSEFDDFGW